MKTVNLNIEVKMNGITVANIPMSIDVKTDNENETQNHNAVNYPLDSISDKELSLAECSYITDTSERTFRRYIKKGELKCVRRHGRKIFIDSKELKRFMKKYMNL